MRIRITDNRWIYLDFLSTDQEEVIVNEFSAKDPKSRYISDVENQHWDGYYRRYNVTKQRMSRAFLCDLISICNKYDFPYQLEDLRPPPKHNPVDRSCVDKRWLQSENDPNIILDDHQLKSLHLVYENEVGIFAVHTGGGKTEIMAGIIKMFPACPTVIIAEQLVVVDQIKKRLELRMIVEEVGEFYAGKRPNGQIVVVGSIQSLMSPKPAQLRKIKKSKESEAIKERKIRAYYTRVKNSKKLQKIISKCDLLLVDESDRSSSSMYNDLFFKWTNPRRKYGFTGTPFDDDRPVENLLLRERLGNIILQTSRRELEKIGRIIPVEYLMIVFGDFEDRNKKERNDYAVKTYMDQNELYHDHIARWVKVYEKKDYGKLVLVEHTDLGFAIQNILCKKYKIKAEFMYGKTSKKHREEIRERFERRETKNLIGSKILKRGLDLKGGIEAMVLAYDGKLESDFDQRIGRVVRKNKRGKAVVIDTLFYNNYYLYQHSRARLKAAVKMGYKTTVIFPNGSYIDGEELIKRRFRRPKPNARSKK